ncbi:6166_t:CDS:1, partial [Acaulospora morrowiae]
MSLSYAALVTQNIIRRNTHSDSRNAPRTRGCYRCGREGHYLQECLENVPPVSVAPMAKNPVSNVYYCKWQSEEKNGMDAYIAGGTTPAKRGRPKYKPESSSGESSHVLKIRRAVNLIEPMEISIQLMEKE